MNNDLAGVKDSTNVRLYLAVFAAFLVTGCASVAPLDGRLAPCPTPGPRICEAFGPQLRCACADAAHLDRQLARFSRSAQIGPRGW